MNDGISRGEARTALTTAGVIDAKVRATGRWYASWAACYAVLTAGCTAVLGLFPGPGVIVVATLTWASAIALLTALAQRRSATVPRGQGRRHGMMILAWALLYGAVLLIGLYLFPGEPAWWIPGALLTAVPPAVAAWQTLRATTEAGRR
ncbi:hypothetical protein ACQEU5_02070 [Marinactinospora thermotolerans]|uniref:Uncharacterized protein n=1 Tax=Marinactinospora thermotolerans DSM 45154 TaxID=1122192 RepID=A0A1T4M0X3_9ACTN|nr:hypothetical protein [Marinactinospora thermotolerans]SJZ60561.1 hypothetical protein SAMN02745673_00896 [Marinactinospora thermotolerans DSM 45154]